MQVEVQDLVYDPLGCQERPRLGYLADFADMDERLARGEKQSFCTRCERWRWKDQLCSQAVVETVDYGL